MPSDSAIVMRERFEVDTRINSDVANGDGKCRLNQGPYAGKEFLEISKNYPAQCGEIGQDIAKS